MDVFWLGISIDAANRGSEIPLILARKLLSREPGGRRIVFQVAVLPVGRAFSCSVYGYPFIMLLAAADCLLRWLPALSMRGKKRKTKNSCLFPKGATRSFIMEPFRFFFFFWHLGDHFNKKGGQKWLMVMVIGASMLNFLDFRSRPALSVIGPAWFLIRNRGQRREALC